MTHALLPEGFHDLLPPAADAAARVVSRLLDAARLHGYERVEAPLAEFEDALASRLKAGRTRDAVRFVDPVSQAGLAIRPDITAQVGRIAASRMAHHPRPVRLSYAGPVLKLKAGALDPARARHQVGCELIGRDTVAAAREIVAVAVAALSAAGVAGVSIDFALPDLVDTLTAARPVADRDALRDALDAKDAGRVADLAPDWLPLIAAAGPFDQALAKLRAFDTHGALATRLDGLAAIAEGLDVRLTLDPTEHRSFEFQSWFGFSIFADGVTRELGRGGSYTVMHDDGREEPATGFTLYRDAVLASGAAADPRRRLFVPHGADPAAAARLRAEGWVTVQGLEPEDSAAAQLCTHQLVDGQPKEI